MRQVLRILLLVLILSGCEKPEDVVVPIPPQTENIPPAAPEGAAEISEKPKPPANSVANEDFLEGKFKGMPYRILVPRNYDSTKQYPLHVFLHGIGERGSDNERQLSVGGSRFQVDSVRNKYRAFIVFPQCPSTHYWFSDDILSKLRSLIDTLSEMYPVKEDRISIGGFSMGAYGTFEMVARNSGLFESAIAISGDGDERDAPLMAKTKWRIFAGERDDIVPSIKTRNMANALEQAGAIVSFFLYPNADHGHTWVNAFAEPDYFQWLFSRAAGDDDEEDEDDDPVSE